MKWFSLISALIFHTPIGLAQGLEENPAFCFGVISAHSSAEAAAILRRQAEVRSTFDKQGPKDSTDERSFDDWSLIGRDVLSETAEPERTSILNRCKKSIRAGVK